MRLLKHLESELVELERALEDFDPDKGGEDHLRNQYYRYMQGSSSPHGSIRSRSSNGTSNGDSGLEAKRAELMDALAWKLGQYSKYNYLSPKFEKCIANKIPFRSSTG